MAIYAGIDVGTGSARAGLFNDDGSLIASVAHPIRTWASPGEIFEQSSEDIWQAICAALRQALLDGQVDPASVKGVGFDATCSMVIIGKDETPLPTLRDGEPSRNVIVWMDHRATGQAERINREPHHVLSYVGGRISPEMQVPKLLWLKENNPSTFDTAEQFFDLADYLTFRATGDATRSLCTVTCKWTYLGHEHRWDQDFFRAVGLQELAEEDFARIGRIVGDIGSPIARGLLATAADELGLLPDTPVGLSAIDAHAGAIGTIAAPSNGDDLGDPTSRLALIMGTSACAMTVSPEPTFVDGVWGPYKSAILPGLWLNEGGQSAFGAALAYIVALHPAAPAAKELASAEGVELLVLLERMAIEEPGGIADAARLASNIHVVPELLGNRSPEADPSTTGMIAGLRLDDSIENLVELYVATLCGLCYGTCDIIDGLVGNGLPLETIIVSGGAARSELFRRILADSTGLTVHLPSTIEPVLLGAAIIGACAHKGGSLIDLATGMSKMKEAIPPQTGEIRRFHEKKREAYHALRDTDKHIRQIMNR
ncbi:D-ribulokinase [Rhizobium sp. NFR07]|uniref:FGGY-family carbohydrate kinase n=1 Tax=Rhizobium sp. NFR07 TaxID=1566262 RepID=UPI0008F058CD|nr:FGGY-family carbohydrate kinase [Rhizobium sp. NFR07]SFA72601.1 D-ribulokinase [Rhizobium sp. NFR07]